MVHFIMVSDGWKLTPEINLLVDDREIFDKGTFGSMELARYVSSMFQAGEIDAVQLVGVCTDICVISNAILLKASEPEMEVSVDGRCCAGTTPANHRKALEVMRLCQISVEE